MAGKGTFCGHIQLDLLESMQELMSEGSRFVTIRDLCEHTGRDERNVYSALRGLRGKGFVRRESKTWKSKAHYYSITLWGEAAVYVMHKRGHTGGVPQYSRGKR